VLGNRVDARTFRLVPNALGLDHQIIGIGATMSPLVNRDTPACSVPDM
jgi:hypothetical protein